MEKGEESNSNIIEELEARMGYLAPPFGSTTNTAGEDITHYRLCRNSSHCAGATRYDTYRDVMEFNTQEAWAGWMKLQQKRRQEACTEREKRACLLEDVWYFRGVPPMRKTFSRGISHWLQAIPRAGINLHCPNDACWIAALANIMEKSFDNRKTAASCLRKLASVIATQAFRDVESVSVPLREGEEYGIRRQAVVEWVKGVPVDAGDIWLLVRVSPEVVRSLPFLLMAQVVDAISLACNSIASRIRIRLCGLEEGTYVPECDDIIVADPVRRYKEIRKLDNKE